jgi:hypothetical protein
MATSDGQTANLKRVAAHIGGIILSFCKDKISKGTPYFHAAELRDHVAKVAPWVAPDSPSRILRDLRQRGAVKYKLVSRAKSFYRLTSVRRRAAA